MPCVRVWLVQPPIGWLSSALEQSIDACAGSWYDNQPRAVSSCSSSCGGAKALKPCWETSAAPAATKPRWGPSGLSHSQRLDGTLHRSPPEMRGRSTCNRLSPLGLEHQSLSAGLTQCRRLLPSHGRHVSSPALCASVLVQLASFCPIVGVRDSL